MSTEVMQTSRRKERILAQVHCGPRVQTLFVVIPGVGTLNPESWEDGRGSYWLRSVRPVSAPDIGIFAFENGLASGEALSWRQIEDAGADFLGSLFALSQEELLRKCPIILISHSLGGIILKRAISLLHQQTLRFQHLLRNIACSILLSCPHSRFDDLSIWQNIPLILKKYSKSKTKHIITTEIAKGLAEDSLSFELAFEKISVLTLYETLETRTGGIFGGRTMLVGRTLARTNTQLENMLGVEADHNNICCLRDGSLELATVVSFINNATEAAKHVIKKGPEEYKRPPVLQQSTLRTRSSIASIEDQRAKKDSKGDQSSSHLSPSKGTTGNQATAGSAPAKYEALADFSVIKSEPLLPCHIMPYSRNREFFGRSSILALLEEALYPSGNDLSCVDSLDNSTTLRTFAVCGPGGMGKTQLASEFVYRSKARFDAIFWIHADEPSKIEEGFNNVAITLGLVAKDSVESRDKVLTKDLVLGWLANPLKSYKRLENEKPEEASWLLVFDNVDNPDALDKFWPMESTGSVLITSRDPLVKTYIYSHDSGIALPPFDDEEAIQFLLKLTGREKEKEERDWGPALVQALEGYPLAISQIAPVIVRNELTFPEFLAKYEKESYRAELFKEEIGKPKIRSGYDHSLVTVFALENLKKSRFLLDVLSLLDPDSIPEYILEASAASASWQGYPENSEAYEKARTELLQSSLITRDRSAKRLVIHRLIQDVARSKMSDERFNMIFKSALCLISAVWPYEKFGFGNEMYRWARCNELRPHILRLQKLNTRFTPPTELSVESIEGPRLLLECAWFSLMLSNYNDTYTLLDMAQYLATRLQSEMQSEQRADSSELKDQLDTLVRTSYHHRGCFGLHVNQPEVSLSNHRKFTQMLREKFGNTPRGDDQSLGVALNELGNAYLQNKAWADGVDCFKKSISELESLDGATRISISMPLINLAFAYWLEGLLDKAASTFQEALEDREKEYGVDDKTSFVTGKLLLGYGNVQAARGLLDESFTLHKRCLVQYKATIGNNHHRTADGCVKVADHFIRIGQYDSALTLLNQAHKIFSAREHFTPEKARVCYKRARLYEILGRFNDAQVDFREALSLYHSIRPGDSTPLAQLSDKDFDENIMFWSR